ncbi:hypothetical protein Bbelb_266940 [Branchiostoma belcheri]|nr:hypothetical protein Bbelb_266940 [Branchiostoma belcheri]
MAAITDTRSFVRAVQDLFGVERLREHQQSMLRALLDGRDVFLSVQTGGGKSLCYMGFPAAAKALAKAETELGQAPRHLIGRRHAAGGLPDEMGPAGRREQTQRYFPDDTPFVILRQNVSSGLNGSLDVLSYISVVCTLAVLISKQMRKAPVTHSRMWLPKHCRTPPNHGREQGWLSRQVFSRSATVRLRQPNVSKCLTVLTLLAEAAGNYEDSPNPSLLSWSCVGVPVFGVPVLTDSPLPMNSDLAVSWGLKTNCFLQVKFAVKRSTDGINARPSDKNGVTDCTCGACSWDLYYIKTPVQLDTGPLYGDSRLVGATGTHCRRIAYGRLGARYRAGDQCMHDDLQGPQRRIPQACLKQSGVDGRLGHGWGLVGWLMGPDPDMMEMVPHKFSELAAAKLDIRTVGCRWMDGRDRPNSSESGFL